jgi:hypothetical protein
MTAVSSSTGRARIAPIIFFLLNWMEDSTESLETKANLSVLERNYGSPSWLERASNIHRKRPYLFYIFTNLEFSHEKSRKLSLFDVAGYNLTHLG